MPRSPNAFDKTRSALFKLKAGGHVKPHKYTLGGTLCSNRPLAAVGLLPSKSQLKNIDFHLKTALTLFTIRAYSESTVLNFHSSGNVADFIVCITCMPKHYSYNCNYRNTSLPIKYKACETRINM